jgi:hypothetical protein
MPLVCSAATAFVMYSDQPDIVRLRTEVMAAYLEATTPAAAPESKEAVTDLQRLRNRTTSEVAPCLMSDDCAPQPPAQGGSSPRFIKVAPAE